mmetsp:Transcript_2634/g.5758  ORF Transcript_2634/g.5758 Transcript_2634/m.5758 type:complete len:331 (-) Transcript_2634:100-1092(-)
MMKYYLPIIVVLFNNLLCISFAETEINDSLLVRDGKPFQNGAPSLSTGRQLKDIEKRKRLRPHKTTRPMVTIGRKKNKDDAVALNQPNPIIIGSDKKKKKKKKGKPGKRKSRSKPQKKEAEEDMKPNNNSDGGGSQQQWGKGNGKDKEDEMRPNSGGGDNNWPKPQQSKDKSNYDSDDLNVMGYVSGSQEMELMDNGSNGYAIINGNIHVFVDDDKKGDGGRNRRRNNNASRSSKKKKDDDNNKQQPQMQMQKADAGPNKKRSQQKKSQKKQQQSGSSSKNTNKNNGGGLNMMGYKSESQGKGGGNDGPKGYSIKNGDIFVRVDDDRRRN